MEMQFRKLGSTGIQVSRLALGAGPVPELMTEDASQRQTQVMRRALDCGINWIDTAATYGMGKSEESIGALLERLDAKGQVHIATKVRLMGQELEDIPRAIQHSVVGSLKRLRLSKVTLLQLHNSITQRRGDEPTSISPTDVLGPVLDSFRRLRDEGLIEHFGLTGIGQPDALREVVASQQFATIQVPFNLLNPSAGEVVADNYAETDYGNIIADCVKQSMGVFAIRVFAGGALAGQPPSAHTFKTKFFPLDLYERDQKRCAELGDSANVKEAALQFVLQREEISSAIIGFGQPDHVDEAVACFSKQTPD